LDQIFTPREHPQNSVRNEINEMKINEVKIFVGSVYEQKTCNIPETAAR